VAPQPSDSRPPPPPPPPPAPPWSEHAKWARGGASVGNHANETTHTTSKKGTLWRGHAQQKHFRPDATDEILECTATTSPDSESSLQEASQNGRLAAENNIETPERKHRFGRHGSTTSPRMVKVNQYNRDNPSRRHTGAMRRSTIVADANRGLSPPDPTTPTNVQMNTHKTKSKRGSDKLQDTKLLICDITKENIPKKAHQRHTFRDLLKIRSMTQRCAHVQTEKIPFCNSRRVVRSRACA